MRIVFLSCHLTGTGHLVRTLALAHAARRLGHDPVVITGGRLLDHLDPAGVPVVQLPPVVVRGFEFTTLRRPDGSLVSDDYMASRSEMLGQTLWTLRPHALVTELFPFGRRVLAREFLQAIAAVRAARPEASILASVRDVPEPKPARLAETAERLRADYDGVLVHGDADFLPLSVTWPLPADLSARLHHVGYVGGPDAPPAGPRADTVLVAVGGGILGRRLLDIAGEAAKRSARQWRLLVGGADAAARAAELAGRHEATNLSVEPARPDYRSLLAAAACSVSLCGYNTAVEIARCATPAILVPSEEAGEQEQLIRARRLSEHPGIRLMRLDGLMPEGLATAVEMLATGRPRQPIPLAGDDGTAAIAKIAEICRVRSVG